MVLQEYPLVVSRINLMDYYIMNLKEHLLSRHVDLELHNPVLDQEDMVATFYLYSLSGELVGYQQYRPLASKEKNNDPKEGRYFTYKTKGKVGVFGLESLHLTPHVVFVTEGVFDACRLTELRFSALAVLANNPDSSTRNFLMSLGRKVVVVADNDKAGKMLASAGHEAVFTEDKDLGDSSEEFVLALTNRYK